jgi:hypothetical protein
VTFGSFCRNDPAAVLRGLAKGGLPASTSDALSAWKSSSRKYTSPRTSISAGTGNSAVPVSRSGTSSRVRMLSVMSSPVRPSPRVSALVSLPFS